MQSTCSIFANPLEERNLRREILFYCGTELSAGNILSSRNLRSAGICQKSTCYERTRSAGPVMSSIGMRSSPADMSMSPPARFVHNSAVSLLRLITFLFLLFGGTGISQVAATDWHEMELEISVPLSIDLAFGQNAINKLANAVAEGMIKTSCMAIASHFGDAVECYVGQDSTISSAAGHITRATMTFGIDAGIFGGF